MEGTIIETAIRILSFNWAHEDNFINKTFRLLCATGCAFVIIYDLAEENYLLVVAEIALPFVAVWRGLAIFSRELFL